MTNVGIHFIGIEGIGMSGLATILLEKGFAQVTGSDTKAGNMAEKLKALGAHVFSGHSLENLAITVSTVVVNTDIPQDNPELVEARRRGLSVVHRSDMLKELMEGYDPLVVTGTHGKTTTTALLSHVLYEAGSDPSFAVGGIMLNCGTNARYGKGKYFIAEADESDGTFLKYPYVGAIVTNIDTDHLAHFGSIENLEEAFSQFVQKSSNPQTLVYCGDDERLWKIRPKGISYGFSSRNDLRIEQVRSFEDGMRFDIKLRGVLYKDVAISLLGRHNVLNAAAVFGLCLALGVRETTIRSALFTFRGVKRRLERKLTSSECLIFDDYAHHPTAIKATLAALRQTIGERRLIAIYQPHRVSRMNYVAHELVDAFHEADVIVVTDLYRASESVEGVTSEKIFDIISSSHPGVPVVFISRDKLIDELLTILRPHDVALFLGAGDITKASDDIGKVLKKTHLKKWKIGLVYGGMNSENRVSKASASAIWDALDRNIYDVVPFEIGEDGVWRKTETVEKGKKELKKDNAISKDVFECIQDIDLFIPALHGSFGEDGSIQGFFEIIQKPYVGCPFAAASVAMDKALTKQVVQSIGISVVPYVAIEKREWKERSFEIVEEIVQKLRFPYFVKPVHFGSSVGIEKVQQEGLLKATIEKVFMYDDKVLVEQMVNAREIEYAVFGNEEVIVPCPGEVLTGGKFYDYESKYGKETIKAVPRAELSPEELETGEYLAKKAYIALSCSGLARIDFFLDEKGRFFLNEINSFPNFAKNTMYPSIWRNQGISSRELMNRLVIVAFSRFRKSRKQNGSACLLGKTLETLCFL